MQGTLFNLLTQKNLIKTSVFLVAMSFSLISCGGGGGGAALPPTDPAPSVLSTIPENQTIDIDVAKPIIIKFSEALNITASNISLRKYQTDEPNNFNDPTAVLLATKLPLLANGGVKFDSVNNILTINPIRGAANYSAEARYRIELIDIKDSANNDLPVTQWEFSTTTKPLVTITKPINGNTVSRAQNITVTFSESMDLDTLRDPTLPTTPLNFTLVDFGPAANPTATGTLVPAANIVFNYKPSSNSASYSVPGLLTGRRKYVATLTTAVTDTNGIAIAQNASVTFFTNTTNSSVELPVTVFSVLAKPHVNTVDVSWTTAQLIPSDITKVIRYNIYSREVNAVDNALKILATDITGLNYSDVGKKENTVYQYAVSANYNGQESALMLLTGTVKTLSLLSITGTVTGVTSDAQVDLNWASVNAASAYNLYVKSGVSNKYIKLNKTKITTNQFTHGSVNLTDPGLVAVNGVSYQYKVSVINTNGDEGQQSVASSLFIPNKKPVITSFNANPPSIIVGAGSVLLTARYVNGTGTITESGGASYQPILKAGTTDTYTVSVTPMATTTYTLTVSNGTAPAITKMVTVTIRKPGQLAFEFSSSKVSETIGDPTGSLTTAIAIIVTRSSGNDGPVSVSYQAGGGLAANGTDYVLAPGVVNFTNGDSAPKKIMVGVINNDTLTELTKSFTISLSNPTNGATLGLIKNHTVTIIDNDILTLNFGTKLLKLNWAVYPGATFYKIKRIDALGPKLLNGNSNKTFLNIDVTAHKYDWLNSRYYIDACNDVVCITSNTVTTMNKLDNVIGYFKASNARASDNFGKSIALSGDGNTLAVAAPTEDSDSKGVYSTPNYPAVQFYNSGAVYVFSRSPLGVWKEQAYIKASNTGEKDEFGFSVALNFDGTTLAVGAQNERSSSTGVYSTPNDNLVFAGAAYVFKRDTAGKWKEQAYIKPKNSASMAFGYSIALSASGDTLAVGARLENGSTTGINTTPVQNTANNNTGAAYVFQRALNGIWSQQAYIKAKNAKPYALFGTSISLSDDGNTLAVGAQSDSGTATGVNTVPTDYKTSNSGAAYIYRRSNNTTWFEHSYIKASNNGFSARFGGSIDLSGDGNTLVVGAREENSSTSGVDSTPDLKGSKNGAAYVFFLSKNIWAEQGYIKARSSDSSDYFGEFVTLSRDGNSLAVGAAWEDGSTKGINSTADNLANATGAVYIYERVGAKWVDKVYLKSHVVKPDATLQGEFFGSSVSFDATGKSLAIGAFGEDTSTAIGQTIPNNAAGNSGAVYLY